MAVDRISRDLVQAFQQIDEGEDFLSQEQLIALFRLLSVLKYYKTKQLYESTLMAKTVHNYKQRAKEAVRARIQKEHQLLTLIWDLLAPHQKLLSRELLRTVLFVLYAPGKKLQERTQHLYNAISQEQTQGMDPNQMYFSKQRQKQNTLGKIQDLLRIFKALNADSFALQRDKLESGKKIIGPQYTFKPKISDLSVRIDNRKEMRRVHEQVKRHNLTSPAISPLDCSGTFSQYTIASGLPERSPLQPRLGENKTPGGKRFERLYQKGRQILESRQRRKLEKQASEERDCTFQPKMATKRKLGTSRRVSVEDGGQSVYSRLFRAAKRRGTEQVSSWKAKEEKELEECTFKPKVNTAVDRSFDSIDSSSRAFHKGVDVHVSRMREEYKRKAEKKLAYEQLGKPAYSGDPRPRPFALQTQKRGELPRERIPPILTFEVLISKGRMGRLVVYHPQEAEQKISDFVKTYGLNRNAEEMLRQDVLGSVENYMQEQRAHQLPMALPEREGVFFVR